MSTRQTAPAIALITLILVQLSCRPVMTIGWGEIALFAVLALIVVVPLVIRFLRWMDSTQERRSKRRR